tara:strand:+ start:112 stop:315 length:204 start_codon:yes stop_codon:yes gene_type:complete
MGKEADRDRSIMREVLKLHKKIDYLTDQVMDRLDKMTEKEDEAQKDFPFAPKPEGIKSIRIKGEDNE